MNYNVNLANLSMQITIRQETEADHQAIFDLIKEAFKQEVYSDHQEQFLVDRLRKSDAFIPELSLVAEIDKKVVGHILLTKIKIKNACQTFESLALAPVTVATQHQKKGIGSQLIKTAHEKAKSLGYQSSILLGHPDYYPRFGYVRADKFSIVLPFDVPKENCLAIELVNNSLGEVEGTVEYPTEFYN